MKSNKRDNLLKRVVNLHTSGYHKDFNELKARVSGESYTLGKGPSKRFNVELPEGMHRRLKAKAAEHGLKLNKLAIKLFNEYLSK
ncbi:MAG: toxin-antitoxin system HicB family antitoxin [Thermodesulfobacteriota bacterium]|jgi:predicted HicB family RNase H-like nuclease